MDGDDEARLNQLTEQLQRLQLQQRQVQEEIQTIRRRHNQRNRARRSPFRIDANGDEIKVGDRVRFLTRGRYNSTEGVIVRFGTRFVVSIDDSKNYINREYGNVELITRNEDNEQ